MEEAERDFYLKKATVTHFFIFSPILCMQHEQHPSLD